MISVIFTFFKNLPTSFKVTLSGVAVCLAAMIAFIPSKAVFIIIIGIVVIGLLLILYLLLLKWLKKRKAIPMERDLMKNASAAPLVSSSDPKVMAQQDDLRKKFERGIEEFRAHGNDFYDIPWYMIVGEPGSGKTEAIRHSNINFPPGVQDMLQGSGGTINMNWWFTEQAVILDTAGRMMFEQVEEGGGHDWKELLNLLKKYRQFCPINGILLVIPADSLIRDTADEIGKKADKIAQQFDVIQRTLDVRFPVFVVITKSDLINGFRDFFDNITEPQLQHQILGWSNPQPIDEPYRPDFIDKHVKMIKERLFRRRFVLMQQIICGESGVKEKRLADILYTFPQSITSIAPRLARYLELIFRAGSRWSGKPLFFRGIYFTSSMREGSVLDGELAETLGVPVDSLPDGRAWERDRAYFLRDLLVKKVFPEKGLVTSALDAKKQHTHRKFIFLTTIAASVLFLFICMISAQRSYKRIIGELNGFLRESAKLLIEDPDKLSLVQAEPKDPNYPKPNDYRIVPEVIQKNLSGNLADAVGNYKPHWMFIPIDQAEGTSDELCKATRIIYKASVLKPLLSAACDVMTTVHKRKRYCEDDPNDPNEPLALALRQLIRIKAYKSLSEEKADSYSRSNFIDNLSNFIIQFGAPTTEVREESEVLYTKNKSNLHKPLKSEYKIFKDEWRPVFIMNDDPNSLDDAINNGIRQFNLYYWQTFEPVQDIKNLKNAIVEFKKTETDMLELIRNSNDPGSGPHTSDEQILDDWKEGFKNMDKARGKIEESTDDPDGSLSLMDLCKKALQDVNDGYKFLLDELKSKDPTVDVNDIRKSLEDGYNNIKNELDGEEFRKELESLEKEFWARTDDSRKYKIRLEMYSTVNERLNAEKKSVFDFNAIREIENTDKEARTALNEFPKGSGADDLFSKTFDHCSSVLYLDNQLRLLSVLQAAPNDLDRIKMLVKSKGDWDWEQITNVNVVANDKEYFDPNGAANVMDSWKYLVGAIDDKFKENKIYGYEDKNKIFAEYPEYYCNFWLGTLPEEWINNDIPNEKTWKDQYEKLRYLDFRDVFRRLALFGKCVNGALGAIDLTKNDEIENFKNNLNEINNESYRNDCNDILENWARLRESVFETRKTLLEMKPRSLLRQYFPSSDTYRPKSPAEFVYMYWTRLTLNSLEILIDDTVQTAKDQFTNILNVYGNMFPLKWDGEKELDPNEVQKAYSLLDEIPLWENYEEGTIGSGAVPEEANYTELDNLLEDLSKPSVSNKKKIDRVRQVLQGLPRGQKPYYCKISFVSPISAVHTRRIEIEQDGMKSGRMDIDTSGSEEFCRVEYGTDKSIYINFYQFDNEVTDPNVVQIGKGQLGPFKGPWAILNILRKRRDRDRDSDEVQICLPVPDNDENGMFVEKQLFLKLDFYRYKECIKRIPDFGQALLTKE